MPRTLAVLVMLFAGAGCGKSEKVVGVNCDDVVGTPGGAIPSACVHEIPNGGAVEMTADGTSIVTLDGKVVATYPPCPCAASGGVGPVFPFADGGVDGGACEQLQSDFSAALDMAKECDPNATGQCQVKVSKVLSCDNPCGIVVNDASAVSTVQAKWDTSGCGTIFNTCSPGCAESTLGHCVAQPDGGGICDPSP